MEKNDARGTFFHNDREMPQVGITLKELKKRQTEIRRQVSNAYQDVNKVEVRHPKPSRYDWKQYVGQGPYWNISDMENIKFFDVVRKRREKIQETVIVQKKALKEESKKTRKIEKARFANKERIELLHAKMRMIRGVRRMRSDEEMQRARVAEAEHAVQDVATNVVNNKRASRRMQRRLIRRRRMILGATIYNKSKESTKVIAKTINPYTRERIRKLIDSGNIRATTIKDGRFIVVKKNNDNVTLEKSLKAVVVPKNPEKERIVAKEEQKQARELTANEVFKYKFIRHRDKAPINTVKQIGTETREKVGGELKAVAMEFTSDKTAGRYSVRRLLRALSAQKKKRESAAEIAGLYPVGKVNTAVVEAVKAATDGVQPLKSYQVADAPVVEIAAREIPVIEANVVGSHNKAEQIAAERGMKVMRNDAIPRSTGKQNRYQPGRNIAHGNMPVAVGQNVGRTFVARGF